MINVYIPTYNQNKDLVKSIDSVNGLKTIVIDNKSDKEYDSVLKNVSKKCTVIRNLKNLGRVGNWKECVRHFLNSDAEWMKWLFTGDTLEIDAKSIMEEAIKKYPNAKMIVFEYDIDNGNRLERHKMFDLDKVIEPKEALKLTATKGNWYGTPVGYLIHRDVVKEYFDFGQIPYVADMQFGLNIVSNFNTAYVCKKIGTFNASSRNYYSKYDNTVWTILEDYVLRKQALDRYLRLVNDEKSYNNYVSQLEAEFLKVLEVHKSNMDLSQKIKCEASKKLNIIDEKFEDNYVANCVIWGAGNAGKYVKEVLEERKIKYNIVGFVDKYKTGSLEELEIFKPNDIMKLEIDYIFIATEPGKQEAQNFLKAHNFKKINDFIDLV